jgi:hypothetical protein
MATDDRVIRALLRFGIDSKTLAQVKKGAKSVEDALGDLGDNAEQAAKDVQKEFETVAKSGKYSVKELDTATLELNAAPKKPWVKQDLSAAEEEAAAGAAAVGEETGETGDTLDETTISADDYAKARTIAARFWPDAMMAAGRGCGPFATG